MRKTIYISTSDKGNVPIDEALEIITHDWVTGGNSCEQTVLDLAQALKEARHDCGKAGELLLNTLSLRRELVLVKQMWKETIDENSKLRAELEAATKGR